MAIEQLKKRARNLQRMLPTFVEQHTAPYPLSSCQQIAARLEGYPTFQAAELAMTKGSDVGADPLGAFYGYPWETISPVGLFSAFGPAKHRIHTGGDTRDGLEWLAGSYLRAEAHGPACGIVIAATGGAGRKIVDEVMGDREPYRRAGERSFCRIGSHVGVDAGMLEGATAEEVVATLATILEPVASARQLDACVRLLQLLLAGDRAGGTTVASLATRVCAAAAVTLGGWSKQGDELYDLFDMDTVEDEAKAFFDEFEDLGQAVRPLETLLCRLHAMGALSPVASSMDSGSGDVMDFQSTCGLYCVWVDTGSRKLDHVIGLLSLAKVLRTDLVQPHAGFYESYPMPVLLLHH